MSERLSVNLSEKGQADLAKIMKQTALPKTAAVHRALRLAAYLDGRTVLLREKDGRLREVTIL